METSAHEAVGAAIAASASKTMYAGGTMAGTGILIDSQVIGLLGLLLAAGGFIVNWYYRQRDDARAQAEHERRMSA